MTKYVLLLSVGIFSITISFMFINAGITIVGGITNYPNPYWYSSIWTWIGLTILSFGLASTVLSIYKLSSVLLAKSLEAKP